MGRLTATSPAVAGGGFRPDIEGLRGVAVASVLLFHAGVPFAQGGYIGVDMFFVISGFLITGLLIREKERTGRIRLGAFYARRARRLLPAAGAVVLATVAAAWLIFPPLRLKELAYDAVASALSVANWHHIGRQTDYLAGHTDPSPLLHFWSLAVEEQFYLVWAPLAALCVLAASWKKALALAIALIGAASFAVNLWWVEASGPLAYLGTPTRAWQFALGAGLAFVPALAAAWPRRARVGLAVLAGAGLAASIVAFDSGTPFPGYAALLPTLATGALIAAGGDSAKPLSWSWLRRAGRLSYAWYLWHWPVLVLFEAAAGPQHWVAKLGLVALAAAPAWLTMKLVEEPLRFRAPTVNRTSAGLSVGASSVILPVIAALMVGSGAVTVLSEQSDRAELQAGEAGTRWAAGLPASTDTTLPLYPSPGDAAEDYGTAGECQLEPEETGHPDCVRGEGGGRIVLFGDSHASQWLPAFEAMASERGMSVEVLAKSGCPVADMTVGNDQLGREYRECDRWREDMVERIEDGPAPALIAVGTLNRYTWDAAEAESAWERSFERLTATGAPVAYLRDTPFPGFDVPACLSDEPSDWGACSFERAEAVWDDPVADGIASGGFDGVGIADVSSLVCSTASCPAVVDNLLLYRDDSHLTTAAVRALAPRLEHELVTSGLLAPARPSAPTVAPGDGWEVAFRDDFTGEAGERLSDEWVYDTGTCYPGCPADNWGTGEVAVHTDSTDNVAQDGRGNLAITPLRDEDGGWTSGRIETAKGDFLPPEGGVLRMEASLRLPDVDPADGIGYWPAFWAMGADLRDGYTGWPATGEVDIMENVNGSGETWGAMHCGTVTGGPCQEETGGLGSEPQTCEGCSASFHSYAAEVDYGAGEVRWYLDGSRFFTVTREQIGETAWNDALGNGLFLILNVAVGGNFPDAFHRGPGLTPDADTVSGEPMLVDHVAVYTRGPR
ncbi:acyltransferase family protein [Salininema proteolyticum]|uniref:Acyltransferase family protein n=1 Tax=Salininema proteolyticum TaxID=1607685 RepID=A0ABV8U553_9ACTN